MSDNRAQLLLTALGARLGEAQTFEAYVDAWLAIKAVGDDLRRMETTARKHVAAAAFPQIADPNLKEGTHHFTLADGRKITYTHKITRKVEEGLIPTIRAEFEATNDRPDGLAFDDLLKTKYELVISAFRKVEGTPVEKVVAKMITAKAAETPDLKVT